MTTGIEDRRSALMSEHPEWIPRTLDGWLDECADRYRHRPLVLTEEVTYSYSDVAEQSRRLADGLASLGVQRGDRVGLLMANHPEFVPSSSRSRASERSPSPSIICTARTNWNTFCSSPSAGC